MQWPSCQYIFSNLWSRLPNTITRFFFSSNWSIFNDYTNRVFLRHCLKNCCNIFFRSMISFTKGIQAISHLGSRFLPPIFNDISSDRLSIKNHIFGYTESAKKWAKRQVEQGFSAIFSQIFPIFDDFSKFSSAFSMLYFEKSSNMAHEMRKKFFFYLL